ncbi:GTP-binding protein [bacterium]|nr:GTP-binding protein [bacterium]
MTPNERPIPVTLVTGFLGAGKTTFLNHLLQDEHGARLAVIINEFDEVGIDRDLVRNASGQLVEMNNGCLCCTVQGDLKDVIAEIIASGKELDGIVIETTGLADPGPIATGLFADPFLCDATRLDAIVTLVDAFNVPKLLSPSLSADRAEDGALARAQIGYADVILLNKTDLVTDAEREALKASLRDLNRMARLYEVRQSVVPLSQVLGIEAFEFNARFGPEAPHADGHHHDPGIGSVSFHFERPFDQVKLNTFFCDLLREHGNDLYRCKGVVNVEGLDEPLLFQGVSTLFATASGTWKEGDTRTTRAVFIGRNLDRARLEAGMLGCLAQA